MSFLLAGASCVLNALCYAELASRFPAVVGGAYMYSYSAFNEITAFLVFVQLMLDYHIGAASISRSLASYAVALLEIFPAFKGTIPLWMGSGKELFGGVLSLNILAPILLALLTFVLCQGVRESSAVNSVMTATKVVIVLVVICAGAFEIDVANWSPFAPNGFKAVLTGATVVFFSYVGFDAVANSAEESKNPQVYVYPCIYMYRYLFNEDLLFTQCLTGMYHVQRDLPIGIMGSLGVCISLYIGVCLVLTGMVPFSLLSEDAPLAEAFSSKGMKFVSILISIGAVTGLTTTLLVGLYVQVNLDIYIYIDMYVPGFFLCAAKRYL